MGLYLFAPLVRLLYVRSTPRSRSLWVVGILGLAILDALYRRALGAQPGDVYKRQVPSPAGGGGGIML